MFFKYVFKKLKLIYNEYAMKIMCNVFKNKICKEEKKL